MRKNEGIVIPPVIWETIQTLNSEDGWALFQAICSYGIDGVEVPLQGNLKALYTLAKLHLELAEEEKPMAEEKPDVQTQWDEMKNPNQTKVYPNENQDIDYDIDIDKDIDMDKDMDYERVDTAQAPVSPPDGEVTAHTPISDCSEMRTKRSIVSTPVRTETCKSPAQRSCVPAGWPGSSP